MITCSFELKFVHVTSGEIIVYCIINRLPGKTKLLIILFELGQLVKFLLALI